MSTLTRHSDALEGFTLLAKNTTGLQCVMVIKQVLREPSIFVFGELLQEANVKEVNKHVERTLCICIDCVECSTFRFLALCKLAHTVSIVLLGLLTTALCTQLANGEHASWYELLRIFAYGTYNDYKNSASSLPPLTSPSPELTKLKQLTVATLASQHKTLPYDLLLRDLDLNNVRELEDLIIDCVYHGLIDAKIDQYERVLHVSYAMGRDLAPNDLGDMLATLDSWVHTSSTLLSTLTEKNAASETVVGTESCRTGEI